ncbi:MAG: hypothetical protein A2787_00280 [Omnitrophica WOR_2 bacterium RIFCSPHIGHO2_01_FULL_48_9]|nr:MAG: hypothetical protein A3D10_06490 [Omnitrophica WOR_2 bacterium RIFCSPHIGHO2_02_FULL_48_11]OGX33088.1 MAG: hypothetical protein A2787_00280 [Omnitrophica WOR_2 bacterium RIFCSPHIGHO2_01_FULL_48_9]
MIFTRIFALALSVLTILIYFPALHSPFLFDDLPFITYSPLIQDLNNWKEMYFFNPPRFIGTYSFALNYHFFKDNVFAYHVINLGIHLISAFLVGWLVKLTWATPGMQNAVKSSRPAGKSPAVNPAMLAALTALLFAVHPLQTMAVNHITQRYTILAAMLYLLAFTLYVNGRLQPARPYYFLFAALAAMAGMFTRQNTITLPFLIILYEFLFFGFKKIKASYGFYGLLLALFILIIPALYSSVGYGFFTTNSPSQSHDFETITPLTYFLTQFRVIPTYLKLFIWPTQLNFDYDFRISSSLWEPASTLWGGVFLICLLIFTVSMIKKDKLIAFSLLWFFLALSVESSVLIIPYVITEYRMYLPSVGLCLLAAYGLLKFVKKPAWLILLSAFLISALSYLTLERNKIWGNEMALWEDTMKKSPQKSRPYVNLSGAHFMRGHYDEAIFYAQKALELNPQELTAHYNLTSAYSQKGEYATALQCALRAYELSPSHINNVQLLAYIYFKLKDYPQAITYYQKLIEITPQKEAAITDYIKVILRFYKETNNKATALDYAAFLKQFGLDQDVHLLLDSLP